MKRVQTDLLVSNMCGNSEYVLQIMSYFGKQVLKLIVEVCEFSVLRIGFIIKISINTVTHKFV